LSLHPIGYPYGRLFLADFALRRKRRGLRHIGSFHGNILFPKLSAGIYHAWVTAFFILGERYAPSVQWGSGWGKSSVREVDLGTRKHRGIKLLIWMEIKRLKFDGIESNYSMTNLAEAITRPHDNGAVRIVAIKKQELTFSDNIMKDEQCA
jgi:hypothetical protein